MSCLWLLRGQRSVHHLGLNSATNTRSRGLQQRAAQSSSGSQAWAPTSGISFSWEPISGLTPDLLNQTLRGSSQKPMLLGALQVIQRPTGVQEPQGLRIRKARVGSWGWYGWHSHATETAGSFSLPALTPSIYGSHLCGRRVSCGRHTCVPGRKKGQIRNGGEPVWGKQTSFTNIFCSRLRDLRCHTARLGRCRVWLPGGQ